MITVRALPAALVAAALLADPAVAGDEQAKLREFVLMDESERGATPREATILMMYDAYHRQLWTSKVGAVEKTLKTLEAVCGKSREHTVRCRAQLLHLLGKYRS